MVLSLCWLYCYQPKNSKQEQKGRPVDYFKIAILSEQRNIDWVFDDAKPIKLSPKNLEDIEILLADCIRSYNLEKEEAMKDANSITPKSGVVPNNDIIVLAEYYRQYVAVTNKEGEIEVWINCLCDVSNSDWKDEVMIVFDGGKCYFSLKINLTKHEYYALMVNGHG